MAISRVYEGSIKKGQEVIIKGVEQKSRKGKIVKIFLLREQKELK
jgi:predicted membrane GTPase involved in stress response